MSHPAINQARRSTHQQFHQSPNPLHAPSSNHPPQQGRPSGFYVVQPTGYESENTRQLMDGNAKILHMVKIIRGQIKSLGEGGAQVVHAAIAKELSSFNAVWSASHDAVLREMSGFKARFS